MNNEIQLYDSLNKDPQALERLGMVLGKSGMFGFSRQEQGVTMMAICVTERMTPLTYMRKFHTMPNGSISLKAGAALERFEEMGGKFEWLESGDGEYKNEIERKATGEFISKSGRKIKYSYSIADARREQLVKKDSRWEKRPGSMLRARVITNALGMIEPSIFFGEVDDNENATAAGLDLSNAPAPTSTTVVAEPVKAATGTGKPSNVIDAEIVQKPASDRVAKPAQPESEKELADAGLAPEIFKAAVDGNGKLTAETVKAIWKAVGIENADTVSLKLMKSGWFKDGHIEDVAVGRAQRILDDPKKFLQALGIVGGAK